MNLSRNSRSLVDAIVGQVPELGVVVPELGSPRPRLTARVRRGLKVLGLTPREAKDLQAARAWLAAHGLGG